MTDQTRPLWADLPHGDEISALLDELRDLTDAEVRAMSTAWGAVPEAAWRGAGRAAEDVARGAARRGAPLDAAEGAAGRAAWDTALALVVADLVGQYGLTREHLDTLTAPARVIPRLAAIINRALPTTYR